MAQSTTFAPFVTLSIAGEEIAKRFFVDFEWKALINDGYIIHCNVSDPYLETFRRLVQGDYLARARKGKPLVVKFMLSWSDTPDLKTPERIAYITDFRVTGSVNNAFLDFVAIDPPSWWLNAGKGDGKVFTGKVSDVIEQVVDEFAKEISVTVTKTRDSEDGKWAMMRQDPKTFIKSLLDWSASITPKKTQWMIASKDKELIIKEQFDFPDKGKVIAIFKATDDKQKNDLLEFELLSDVSLTLLQNKMITQGLSTVSGKFIDKQTAKDKTEVRDDTTCNKINAKIDSRLGYSKPEEDFATSIMAVPEFSDGALGIKYEEYIDGRARQIYLNMLPMIMKMRIQVMGDHRFHDPSRIGVTTVELQWKDIEEEDFFLSGKWLISGWIHYVTREEWVTDIYLYRIDHDAAAQKV